jgi:hypothetical protein
MLLAFISAHLASFTHLQKRRVIAKVRQNYERKGTPGQFRENRAHLTKPLQSRRITRWSTLEALCRHGIGFLTRECPQEGAKCIRD